MIKKKTKKNEVTQLNESWTRSRLLGLDQPQKWPWSPDLDPSKPPQTTQDSETQMTS